MQSLSFTKTRIAPTPSGFLHLGNILSFAITATLAHKANASILLRIDDLDRQRAQPEYVQDIFDTLQFLQIPWHEGPRDADEFEKQYSQVHRMHIYKQALALLAERKEVFACDCSRAQLNRANTEGIYTGECLHKNISLQTADCNWRLFTDTTTNLEIKSIDGIVAIHKLPHAMRYFVVKKKDNYPAYQLSSLMDDIYYGVDGIIRGQDLWDSTLAQHFLANKLGKKNFQETIFFHHPLLKELNGDKLSKSAGSTSIHYLRKQGKIATEIFASIGIMAGIKEPVYDWLTLGEAFI